MPRKNLKYKMVQQIDNCPKVLRKSNKLKNAFKRSRYRRTLSHHWCDLQ